MTWALMFTSLAIGGCIAFIIVRVRRYKSASRSALLGAFATLNLAVAVLLFQILSASAIRSIMVALLLFVALWFFVAEIRTSRDTLT